MSGDAEHVEEWLAGEALARIFLQDAPDFSGGVPARGEPGFEVYILTRCAEVLRPCMAAGRDWGSAFEEIAGMVRRSLSDGILPVQVPGLARRILSVLEPGLDVSAIPEGGLTVLTAQMANALLSLMKRDEDVEVALLSLGAFERLWGKACVDGLSRLWCALLKTSDVGLARCRAGKLGDAWSGVSLGCVERDELRTFFCFTRQSLESPGWRVLMRGYGDGLEACVERGGRDWMALLSAPGMWFFGQYEALSEASRKRLDEALSLGGGGHLNAPSWSDVLVARAQDERAIMSWLCREPLEVPVHHPQTACLLDALSRRDSGDARWHVRFLREFDLDVLERGWVLWPDSRDGQCERGADFAVYWAAVGYGDAGAPERGVSLIESWLARVAPSPCLLWLLGKLALSTSFPARALMAAAQAEEREPCVIGWPWRETVACLRERWGDAVATLRHQYGAQALARASSASHPDEEALRGALEFGDMEVRAEAASCIVDGAMESLYGDVARALDEGVAMRAPFVERYVRRVTVQPEYSLEGAKILDLLDDATRDAPEICLFEAVIGDGGAEACLAGIERCLCRLDPDTDLCWAAVDVWIALQSHRGAFVEAASGVVEWLGLEDPRASRALLGLMAAYPREVRPVIYGVLGESLGSEGARKAFERIRELENPARDLDVRIRERREANARKGVDVSVEEVAGWMLPASWQWVRRMAEIREAGEHRARRCEEVLRARGLVSKKSEPAPEPARWEHRVQPRASDAFDDGVKK